MLRPAPVASRGEGDSGVGAATRPGACGHVRCCGSVVGFARAAKSGEALVRLAALVVRGVCASGTDGAERCDGRAHLCRVVLVFVVGVPGSRAGLCASLCLVLAGWQT